jgi:hypothetical protein
MSKFARPGEIQRTPVDYEKLKADSRAPVEAEAREFTSSLGLETPEQMRKWCLEKIKSSKLLRRVKV